MRKPVLIAGGCAIVLLSFVLRGVNVENGLPQLLTVDENTQVETALTILAGDPNPHFFRYPTAHMYLLSGLYFLVGETEVVKDPILRYVAARYVTIVMGSLTVLIIFLLVRSLYGVLPAFLSACLLAVNPLHVEASRSATVDVPMLFWLTLMLFLLCAKWRTARTGPSRNTDHAWYWPVLSAVAFGLAMSTKYNALYVYPVYLAGLWFKYDLMPSSVTRRSRHIVGSLLGAAVIAFGGVAILLLGYSDKVMVISARFTTDGNIELEYAALFSRVGIACALATIGAAGLAYSLFRSSQNSPLLRFADLRFVSLVVLPFIVFSATSPYVLIDWQHSLRDILYEVRHMAIGSAAHYPVGSPGYQLYMESRSFLAGIRYYSHVLAGSYGYAVLIGALVGAVLAMLRREWQVLVTLANMLLVLGILLSWSNHAARYTVIIMPMFLVLIAYMIQQAAHWRWRYRSMMLMVAGLLLLYQPATATWSQMQKHMLPDTRTLALNWILKHSQSSDGVACDDRTLHLQFLPQLSPHFMSSASVLMDLTPQQIEQCAYRYIVLRDLPAIIGPSDDRRRMLEKCYQEVVRINSKPGVNRGSTIYIYRCNP